LTNNKGHLELAVHVSTNHFKCCGGLLRSGRRTVRTAKKQ